MSEENVPEVRNEAVRKYFATFENDTEAFRDVLHPEIEWYPIEENHTPTRGVEAAMWNRSAWLETWDEHHFDVEDVIEDGDNVVALIHVLARGKGSGIEVDLRFYAEFRVRDGTVAWIYEHEDRAAALESAGLSE
jgi:ketosteroid isomerase-like protein